MTDIHHGGLEQAVAALLAKKLAPVPATTRHRKSCTRQELAAEIYAKLTSTAFCRRRPYDSEGVLAIIRNALAAKKPISCILGHGPTKNLNNCPHNQADWAEVFAYAQLRKLSGAVEALHEPGLAVRLYVDDARAEQANGISATQTGIYRESLETMIATTPLGQPFSSLITEVVSLKTRYSALNHARYLDKAEARIRVWKEDPANAETLRILAEHAARNLPFCDPEDTEHIREAAHRYLVYYEAEKLCGIWDEPDHLYMRYNLHEGFYQIFTLRKGSVSQPWQGQGALLVTAKGSLDPYLLTRSRASRTSLIHVASEELIRTISPCLPDLPVVINEDSAPEYRIMADTHTHAPMIV